MPALSQLDHYRLLGRSGLRVSPLCLGTMTFGEGWGFGAPADVCRQQVDAYAELGGNFIDTAINYTNGQSEAIVGAALSGRRDRFVLATKYTLNTDPDDPNSGGNHRKNMVRSVETSLKRLSTDHIDLFYVHIWEYRTPVTEVMRALDDLVRAGKVLYLGISDTAAWKIAQANTLAELRGWTSYIALQAEYSLIERDVERELTPMAREFGLGLIPWGALNGGVLTGKYNPIDAAHAGDNKRNRGDGLDARKLSISVAVQEIARDIGRTPAQVALNWLAEQPAVASVLLGARKVEQLRDTLDCLAFTLDPEHRARLDTVSRIAYGFPHDMLTSPDVGRLIGGKTEVEWPGRPH
jgi:aryl-alcohol dehydrogenase-like predicted oxidoreductase